ncbi:hypothetical protein HMPREF3213_01044 [Heyndrickxia coagulans]|uniref:Uncharacterized protein n=1 Tax=Heyndrickxia coagulans TaxID=1398 RepID=A0A133KX49_HEYCO|nr:hypothetical protein HMPREF3213_01044 [Heyndrickxia coagulans]
MSCGQNRLPDRDFCPGLGIAQHRPFLLIELHIKKRRKIEYVIAHFKP